MQLLIWKSNSHDGPFIIHLREGEKERNKRMRGQKTRSETFKDEAKVLTSEHTEPEMSADLNTNRWEGELCSSVPELFVSIKPELRYTA